MRRKRPTDALARRRNTSRPTLASTLLRGVLEGSEQLDQPSAATQATQLSAKPVGLLVDRKESGAPGDFAAMQTADEVMAAVRHELGEETAAALAKRDEPAELKGTETVSFPDPEGSTLN